MTVRDVIEQIIQDLGSVEVRMIDIDRYGIPIARAIIGLKEVCNAWDREEKAKEPDEPKISFEVVPVEDKEE